MGGGRFSRGWRLAGISWRVLKADKQLVLLPIISFIGLAAFSGVFIAAALGAHVFETGVVHTTYNSLGQAHTSRGFVLEPSGYVLLLLWYFVSALVTIFFNASLIADATEKMRGGQPTLGWAMRAASAHIGQIIVWALITTTVGVILRAIQQRLGFLGRLGIALLATGWSLITFFVVPVLLYEDKGAPSAIKRSATLFKERWGEQMVGGGTIGIAIFLAMLPLIILGAFLVIASPVVGVLFLVVSVGGALTIGTALSGIFNAALYQFATTGNAVGEFSSDDLSSAFVPKRRR